MCEYSKAAIVVLLILLIWLVVKPMFVGETFMDSTGTEFVPINAPAYGIRGEPLAISSMDQYTFLQQQHSLDFQNFLQLVPG